jgi:hypothetical protein
MKSHPFLGLSTLVAVGLSAAAALSGCSAGAGSAQTGGTPDDGWDGRTNIEAIFEASCAGCHGQQWSSCWDVQACAGSVDAMVSSGAMPRGGSLSASDRSSLLGWLGAGAPCSGVKPATSSGACVGGGGGTPVASQSATGAWRSGTP